MKNVILCTRLLLLAAVTVLVSQPSAFGQGRIPMGEVTFNTYAPGFGVDAPVTLWDGTGPGLSAGWNAQLVHVTVDNQVVPLFPATTFRNTSAAASYYIQQPQENVLIPGVYGGESATLRLRAWQGASYETATLRGESSDLTLNVGGVPLAGAPYISAPLLAGLQGFMIVPEPSIISVALLGAALLIKRPRR